MDTRKEGVFLTDAAVEKAYELLQREDRDDLKLRLSVQAGGCSGLIYNLQFASTDLDGDTYYEYPGVDLVVDQMSLPYLHGTTVDFQDTLEKQGFVLDNPNSSGSCACGDSFH